MDERRVSWRVLAVAAVLLWIAVVVAVYYVAHKPFTAANILALGRALAGLAGAGLVSALGTGIGLLLFPRLDLTPAERLVWAAATGVALVALAGLLLGALGLLRPWLLWLLTAGGLAATGRPLRGALQAAWSDASWKPEGRFEALLASYCGLMLVVALARALTPPVAWDSLVYHLTGPRLYLAAGHLSHPFDLPYLGFPQLVEMLYTWGMGLAGEQAAAPIHWFYGVLTALTLVTAGRRWLAGTAGWLAAATLLTAPTVVMLAGWPYVDLASMLYATLAFLAIARLNGRGSRPHWWLILAGALAGLALSTKYTALILLPALTLALVLLQVKRRQTPGRLIGLWSLGIWGLALAVWSPWLVKNLVLTGNPTYPFLFGGTYWDSWRSWWYDRPGTGLLSTAPWGLLTAPWDAIIWGLEGLAGYGATIGPLFLAFLPLLALVWRQCTDSQRHWLAAAATFCGVLYGFWLLGVARSALLLQTRLLFPAFGVLALVVGAAVAGTEGLARRPVNVGWLARAVVILVLLLSLVGVGLDTIRESPLPVLLGFESREEYLTRRLGWYDVTIEYLNQKLPPEAVVLFLWEPRSYRCQVECRPDALLDRWLHTTHLYGPDAEAIADAWRDEGVTHVLLYRTGYQGVVDAGFDPVTAEDQATLEGLQRGNLQLVQDFGEAYRLYALKEP